MVSALLRTAPQTQIERSRWPFLLAFLALAACCAFFMLPGSIASKTHLALHGICAQRPSHSLFLGGAALPLDARMTGIYIGAATTGLWLLAAGRARNTRVPPRRVIALLAVFVGLLAADGFNALAVDLGQPHLYEPANGLRLLTGVLGGTALGVALVHLLAVTVWARGNRAAPVVSGVMTLLIPLGVALVLRALARSGLSSLYAPFAIGILLAAVSVFAWLATIALALVTNRGWSYGSFHELAGTLGVGLAAALALIGGLAGLRLVMEVWFGLPQLT
jgi:uncharacterized membrane protein